MNESLHVKIEHDDAVGMKKDILIVEKDLLETIRYTRNYNQLRKQELVMKEKIRKDLAALNALIQAIESVLPKESIHFSEEKTGEAVREVAKIRKKEPRAMEKKKTEIERQIDDIRSKLAELG